MSRRHRRLRDRPHNLSGGNSYTYRRPVYRASPVVEIPRRNFTITYNTYLPKRARALDSTVLRRTRTVRRPLIRTVLSDTKLVPPALRRRHTPDLPVRAATWLPSIDRPWPEWSTPTDRQLTRAETCARRHIRREVLFAMGRTNGQGGRGKPKSNVRC